MGRVCGSFRFWNAHLRFPWAICDAAPAKDNTISHRLARTSARRLYRLAKFVRRPDQCSRGREQRGEFHGSAAGHKESKPVITPATAL